MENNHIDLPSSAASIERATSACHVILSTPPDDGWTPHVHRLTWTQQFPQKLLHVPHGETLPHGTTSLSRSVSSPVPLQPDSLQTRHLVAPEMRLVLGSLVGRAPISLVDSCPNNSVHVAVRVPGVPHPLWPQSTTFNDAVDTTAPLHALHTKLLGNVSHRYTVPDTTPPFGVASVEYLKQENFDENRQ
ncbi:hypothetical protein H257_13962 [Aphanomyces astaci]|uniref:Uncharacterized protein n=1 Tax=Aphanomyces astaci TaxID=112090 RepID=W4FUX8_APHAT|nr:hypothetical protein H257_13962 [Aphanomyces astaci]ETV70589.1 hypothetical protein H257_13962 [Aphanomyces astaci]|eukprot:XP_009839972.1 hypothetical protein H257_13962 [Aphanomyces astaci]